MTDKLQSIESDGFCFEGRSLLNLRYSTGTLQLTLSSTEENEGDEIYVTFDWIHSFRVTDEGDLLKMLDELNGQMVVGVYVYENSEYISWFNDQSANIHLNDEVKNYLVVTTEDVIDVLSSVRPTIGYC